MKLSGQSSMTYTKLPDKTLKKYQNTDKKNLNKISQSGYIQIWDELIKQ